MIKSFLLRGQPTGISQPAASGRDGRLLSTLQVSDPILRHIQIQSPVKARSGPMSYDAKREASMGSFNLCYGGGPGEVVLHRAPSWTVSIQRYLYNVKLFLREVRYF